MPARQIPVRKTAALPKAFRQNPSGLYDADLFCVIFIKILSPFEKPLPIIAFAVPDVFGIGPAAAA